jgi:hypothetical protein
MAALMVGQYSKVWAEGSSDHSALYALKNVTSGDTADLSSEFSKVIRAVMLGTTVSGAASASVAGVIVTLPTGLSGDAGWLLVWGCAA